MHRLDADHIVMTNKEAVNLQKTLAAAAEAVSQLAEYRNNQITTNANEWAKNLQGVVSARKLHDRLIKWQKQIHDAWANGYQDVVRRMNE